MMIMMIIRMMILINIMCACLKKMIVNYVVVTKIIIMITEKMFMVINHMLTNKFSMNPHNFCSNFTYTN